MADMFRAEVAGGDPLVVKLFHPKTTDAAYAQVIAGVAAALRQATHPGLVHVSRVGLARERLAVMRGAFERFSLAQVLARLHTREVHLPPALAFSIVLDLLGGLGAAHDVGVVHGALTPGNVLLSAEGQVGLADFGALQALQASAVLRAAFANKGRSSYRAPELARGEPATVASDLYAVGALLYELLTLRELGAGQALSTRREKWVPPSRVVRTLSSRLDAVVMRLIEVEPSRRFRSALETAQALRDVVASAGGLSSGADLAAFLESMLPKDAVVGALGPVPFESFELDEIAGVFGGEEEVSEVATRAPFSPAAATEVDEDEAPVAPTPAFEDWHAPEGAWPGPRPGLEPRVSDSRQGATTDEHDVAPRPPAVVLPTAAKTLVTFMPPAEALRDTDAEQPKVSELRGPIGRWVPWLLLIAFVGGTAGLALRSRLPSKPTRAGPRCYESPLPRDAAFLSVDAPVFAQFDGVALCSPLTRVAVEPGVHTVRFIDANSGQVTETPVRFELGKTLKITPAFH